MLMNINDMQLIFMSISKLISILLFIKEWIHLEFLLPTPIIQN